MTAITTEQRESFQLSVRELRQISCVTFLVTVVTRRNIKGLDPTKQAFTE
jgi:hypothetical protein